jgi:hypothetical protein
MVGFATSLHLTRHGYRVVGALRNPVSAQTRAEEPVTCTGAIDPGALFLRTHDSRG